MNRAVFLCCGLRTGFLTGCFNRSETHPKIPHLPAVDSAAIRVGSRPNTAVHAFIFSADKTKINKATGDAYQEAIPKARSEQFAEREPAGHKAYFEQVSAHLAHQFKRNGHTWLP
ncbi:hypothetical protein [Larkinella rosea]|uniref:Uncharacterized protein n=1 Tax=Larkinella rosea TaxID=2025312 RepID=A0A3P1C1U0_9BACT|nr:hypothetical protein [Larkinella rosea]RRB07262.1 hypothetical protein EHT25_05655 [Larkinella rosea]